jgi:hypothetical protein
MPWPISAGVFGMLRTMREAPAARRMASQRMPAITLRCSAPAARPAQACAAAAKTCGLTAQTPGNLREMLASAAASVRTPNCCSSRIRCSDSGSTTRTDDAGWPLRNRPPIKADAMLPPPTNAMAGVCMRSSVASGAAPPAGV